jgi:membrane-associated protein
MQIITFLLDFILHIDKHLVLITQQYGALSYFILFSIIFMETGLVIMPFLPGDSLLFAAGSLAALGSFNIFSLLFLCIVAAFIGDTVNYWIGRSLGNALIAKNSRFIKKSHIEKAQKFYEKHGAFAIVLARFVPIVRTFAPFVAGIGEMHYPTFMMYNLLGGVVWVSLFTLAGYFLGNIPFVQEHFEYAVVLIVLVSVGPLVFEFIKHKMEARKK